MDAYQDIVERLARLLQRVPSDQRTELLMKAMVQYADSLEDQHSELSEIKRDDRALRLVIDVERRLTQQGDEEWMPRRRTGDGETPLSSMAAE